MLASPPALGDLTIGKLMTKLPLWPNTMKMAKLGVTTKMAKSSRISLMFK
jgi:hypothetical protein